MGGDGKFLKSLHIVGRGVLTPIFYEDSLILPTPLFFQILSTPSLQLPVSLAEWVITTHLMCHFNDNMDLHMLSLGTRRTLMCVLWNKASNLLWSDTNVVFYWYSI